MSREWKPGDVALVKVTEHHGYEVAVRGVDKWYVAGPRLGSRHGFYDSFFNNEPRPLAVIDPEDREQCERLSEFRLQADIAGVGSHADDMQAALREFIKPEPPKCGAVLTFGDTHVCIGDAGHDEPHYDDECSWSHTEGVTTDD